jgi:peroxiredoxin
MTHLVEMQRALPKLRAAGLKLYVVSYDERDALADFARAHDIGFPMLSDVGSRVIREYGILNTNVAPHEAPFYGIPFPGSYVTDEDGRIVAKFFPRHIAMRESAESFIDGALGEILVSPDEPQAHGGDDDVRIDVVFHGGRSLRNGVPRRIVVRFHLPDGLHVYGEPVPDGMVATRIDVRGSEGLVVEPPVLPPTAPLRLEALDAELRVWSGRVDLVVPVWASDHLVPLVPGPGHPTHADIEVTVRYQACDDRTCRLPKTETFTLRIPLEESATPRLPIFRGNPATTTMASARHFRKMVLRSLVRRPWLALRTVRYLVAQARALRDGPGGSGGH